MFAWLGLVLVAGLMAPEEAKVLASLDQLATSVDDRFAPTADVYALRLHNRQAIDITAIALSLKAEEFGLSQFIVDPNGPGFYESTDLTGAGGTLPTFRGVVLTDSFVLLPVGLNALQVGSTFSESLLETNYTTAGGILVPGGSTSVVAHLSVPTGEVPALPTAGEPIRAVFADQTSVAVNLPDATLYAEPEPSALCLVTILSSTLAINGRSLVGKRKSVRAATHYSKS